MRLCGSLKDSHAGALDRHWHGRCDFRFLCVDDSVAAASVVSISFYFYAQACSHCRSTLWKSRGTPCPDDSTAVAARAVSVLSDVEDAGLAKSGKPSPSDVA